MSIAYAEPKMSGEGGNSLTITYGDLAPGSTVEDIISGKLVTIMLVGPIPFHVHVMPGPKAGEAVFLGCHAVFTPFYVTDAHDRPLHCDDCGRIIIKWIIAMQQQWSEEYHGDEFPEASNKVH